MTDDNRAVASTSLVLSQTGPVGYVQTALFHDVLTGTTYIVANGRDWGKSTVVSWDTIKAVTIRARIAALLAGLNQ